MPHDDDFIHRFEPGDPARRPLLVLHGTGGNEHDLIPLARALDPDAHVLSPRGKVLEAGKPRFFRRLAEGVFDLDDLRLRTRELERFIETAAARYGFDAARAVAVGYSNGANIAASLLLTGTRALSGGILFRPMVPFEPEHLPDLQGRRVLICAGRQDAMVPPASTERLIELVTTAGADVTARWYPTGHGLTTQEVSEAAAWYQERD